MAHIMSFVLDDFQLVPAPLENGCSTHQRLCALTYPVNFQPYPAAVTYNVYSVPHSVVQTKSWHNMYALKYICKPMFHVFIIEFIYLHTNHEWMSGLPTVCYCISWNHKTIDVLCRKSFANLLKWFFLLIFFLIISIIQKKSWPSQSYTSTYL